MVRGSKLPPPQFREVDENRADVYRTTYWHHLIHVPLKTVFRPLSVLNQADLIHSLLCDYFFHHPPEHGQLELCLEGVAAFVRTRDQGHRPLADLMELSLAAWKVEHEKEPEFPVFDSDLKNLRFTTSSQLIALSTKSLPLFLKVLAAEEPFDRPIEDEAQNVLVFKDHQKEVKFVDIQPKVYSIAVKLVEGHSIEEAISSCDFEEVDLAVFQGFFNQVNCGFHQL